ncbi:alpha-ketoglutarate-dependent dioxygenase AlkB family protein [Algoriphagus namhaensis]
MQKGLFAEQKANILPHHGECAYYPEFFSEKKSLDYFDRLKNEIPWRQEPIKIFGKEVMQPRLTALCGDPSVPYGYSGIRMKADPFTDALLEIKNAIEKESQLTFTHVLMNYYRDGQDSMGWHRDNESELGPNPAIASVSFGVPREFQFRFYTDKSEKISIELQSGSLLLMTGETQHHWEHQLPKRKKIHGSRINLTFRRIIARQ